MKHVPILTHIALAALSCQLASAVPTSITAPVEGAVRIGSASTSGYWMFNQHRAGLHTRTGGVGGANDLLAWDVNRYLPGNSNADYNQPVLAIADGYVETSFLNWRGNSVGQLLLRHTDSSGRTYYSGYLHMTDIIDKSSGGLVRAGSVIGRVGRVGATNDHLHFAVYDLVNGQLVSRNAAITQREVLPPVAPPFGLSAAPSQGAVLFNWAASSDPQAAFRIHVSTTLSGWTAATGWDASDNRTPTSLVPVNHGISGSSQYTWSPGSAGAYGAPAAGTTYYWCMRVNLPSRGASMFTSPQAFTMPSTPVTPTPSTDDHGNSQGNATALQLSNGMAGLINYSGDVDFFRVTISTLGSCTFGSTGSTDTMGDLYDASGSLLASNDDANGTNNFSITRTMSPGTYYLRVRGYGSSTGAYNVSVSGQNSPTLPPAGDDHGNTQGSASTLVASNSISARLEVSGDVDYFRIDLAYAAALTVGTSGSTDTMGDLYDASGSLLASNDDANGTNNFSIIRSMHSGTYYLRVRGYGSSSGAYTLLANVSGNPQPPLTGSDDHGNSSGMATYLPRYSNLSGRIETSGDVDYFVFTHSYGGAVTFASTGSTDVMGFLYNASGTLITSNDDSNGTTNFTIAANLAPGTYYLRVTGYGSTTGSYGVSAR